MKFFWGETKEKRAFEDRRENTKAYIDCMRPRCMQLALLKRTGSFYYRCAWHASHYVKLMLDQILNENNFRCEIIWKRTYAHGNVGKSYGNISDSIFFYSGGDDYRWNQQYEQFDARRDGREVSKQRSKWSPMAICDAS